MLLFCANGAGEITWSRVQTPFPDQIYANNITASGTLTVQDLIVEGGNSGITKRTVVADTTTSRKSFSVTSWTRLSGSFEIPANYEPNSTLRVCAGQGRMLLGDSDDHGILEISINNVPCISREFDPHHSTSVATNYYGEIPPIDEIIHISGGDTISVLTTSISGTYGWWGAYTISFLGHDSINHVDLSNAPW